MNPEKPKAVAIVVHGLNLRPQRMEPICELLRSRGIETLRVTLSGHEGGREGLRNFREATRERWHEDLGRASREARARADALGVPLLFVGYSLGAVLCLDVMSSNPEIRFDRIALLAPALALTPIGRTGALYGTLARLGPLSRRITIPSLAHPDYRANRSGTPVGAYRALFDCIRAFRSRPLEAATPILVLAHPRDELVSLSGIRALVRESGAANWTLSEIRGQRNRVPTGAPRHMILDPESLGPDAWSSLAAELLRHLLS